MPITGGCLCGQLRYEIAAEKPIVARLCWCRDCQYTGAGSGTANALFEKRALKVAGDPTVYTSIADSGATMRRSFCPKCGTPLFSDGESRPELIIVRVGSFDDPEIGKPIGAIWTSSAPSWACFDPCLPKGEKGTLPAA